MRLYEAMFVVNYNAAKENYEKVETECLGCITRHGGEIVNSCKWDERRLAYEIKNQKRATFVLAHFRSPAESLPRIERQCGLAEDILRVLITVDEDGDECKPFSPVRDGMSDRRGGGRRTERSSESRPSGTPAPTSGDAAKATPAAEPAAAEPTAAESAAAESAEAKTEES